MLHAYYRKLQFFVAPSLGVIWLSAFLPEKNSTVSHLYRHRHFHRNRHRHHYRRSRRCSENHPCDERMDLFRRYGSHFEFNFFQIVVMGYLHGKYILIYPLSSPRQSI